jgi:hypothetical protein
MFEKLRAFFVSSPSNQNAGCVAEVMFGLYPENAKDDGIEVCEMAMRWIDLGRGGLAARLEIFDESWRALGTMPDLIEWLGTFEIPNIRRTGHVVIDVETFVEGLKALGFVDRTPKPVFA